MASQLQIYDPDQNTLTAVPAGSRRASITIMDGGTRASFMFSPESWAKLKNAVEGHFNRPKIIWHTKIPNGKTDVPDLGGEYKGKTIVIRFAAKSWAVDYNGKLLKGGFKGRQKAVDFIEAWIVDNDK